MTAAPGRLMELRPHFYGVRCYGEDAHVLSPTTRPGRMVVYLPPQRPVVRCPRCAYKLDFREDVPA